MEQQVKRELLNFIENMEYYTQKLKEYECNIDENEFDIKMLAQDINVYTNGFLYDVYGMKVYSEYPE